MDATQRAFAKRIWREVAQYYEDPGNEAKFQEWKQERDAAATKQTRVPQETSRQAALKGA